MLAGGREISQGQHDGCHTAISPAYSMKERNLFVLVAPGFTVNQLVTVPRKLTRKILPNVQSFYKNIGTPKNKKKKQQRSLLLHSFTLYSLVLIRVKAAYIRVNVVKGKTALYWTLEVLSLRVAYSEQWLLGTGGVLVYNVKNKKADLKSLLISRSTQPCVGRQLSVLTSPCMEDAMLLDLFLLEVPASKDGRSQEWVDKVFSTWREGLEAEIMRGSSVASIDYSE
ncbi:hypothetical protein GQ44DRAFT_761678 [Phaeosphaeriaceae sp. PMI808]|nr:hypothetical protein GQ44DRAFT_761678 [Phaeosphaeriaceae sp. PMI808]